MWPFDRAASRPFCVTDATVGELYGRAAAGCSAALPIAIPPGERRRRWRRPSTYGASSRAPGMNRADHVVALGGGVVGDLAGFCAATYQRGVPVVQIPTTLVAQVDSAYGGKTGVDLPEAKNYVGAYHQPAAVLVDPDTLGTLPPAELSAGWVEVLKTALIAGGELWERIGAEAPGCDEHMILACARRSSRSSPRTSATVAAARCSTSGTRSAMRSRPPPLTGATATAKRSGWGLLAALRLSSQEQLRIQVRELLHARGLPVMLEGVGRRGSRARLLPTTRSE